MCYISNVVSSSLMDESDLPNASIDSNKLTKENSSQDTSPKKVCLTKITLLILRMRVMKKELRKALKALLGKVRSLETLSLLKICPITTSLLKC